MYEHRYKYGKQKAIMTVENFKEKLEASQLKIEQRYFWFYCDIREHEKARCTKEPKKTPKLLTHTLLLTFINARNMARQFHL